MSVVGNIASDIAAGAGYLTGWGLRNVAHRSGSQLPGRVALVIDPQIIAHLRSRATRGSIVVCGTNGKTTTTNMLAAMLEEQGLSVICNHDGANMAAGVASALLEKKHADWAVLESDELSTIHILPQLQPTYLVLLNLFRDQLDRTGEIDRVQDTIVTALAATPATTLVVCGDDPLCVSIALRANESGTKVLAFGMGEGMGLPPERVPEARFCQRCGAELAYAFHTYAQLGKFSCPNCEFRSPTLDFVARNVITHGEGVTFDYSCRGRVTALAGQAERDGLAGRTGQAEHANWTGRTGQAELAYQPIRASFGGAYMAYNLLAAVAAATLIGVSTPCMQRAIDSYSPANGRLQHFLVQGREVVLNLAKNPTGFNQNLQMLLADERRKAVFVVINDDYNDGRDVSWIWDVDFERLAENDIVEQVVAGGHRANDLQVRLKYAEVRAAIAQGVSETLDMVSHLPKECPLYVLTNYSALWPAKAELEGMADNNG